MDKKITVDSNCPAACSRNWGTRQAIRPDTVNTRRVISVGLMPNKPTREDVGAHEISNTLTVISASSFVSPLAEMVSPASRTSLPAIGASAACAGMITSSTR